jgi:hypothetical protein
VKELEGRQTHEARQCADPQAVQPMRGVSGEGGALRYCHYCDAYRDRLRCEACGWITNSMAAPPPSALPRAWRTTSDQPASPSEAVAALRSVDRLAALNPNQRGEQS